MNRSRSGNGDLLRSDCRPKRNVDRVLRVARVERCERPRALESGSVGAGDGLSHRRREPAIDRNAYAIEACTQIGSGGRHSDGGDDDRKRSREKANRAAPLREARAVGDRRYASCRYPALTGALSSKSRERRRASQARVASRACRDRRMKSPPPSRRTSPSAQRRPEHERDRFPRRADQFAE